MAKIRKSSKRSVIVQSGRSAKGRSVTSEGAPGESAKAGGDSAKGGAGGSASAEGGSATARSVKRQTTEP